jgi:hypothetical protein
MKDSQNDTFENLMAFEGVIKKSDSQLGQHQIKIQSLKQRKKLERISLPNII